jgi:cob(I)alamin adenosyltransferase
MPRLTKIYTRRGDEGSTSLGGGQQISKGALRIQAIGAVDELNSVIGMALAHGLCERLTEVLQGVQNELFHLGVDLSFLPEDRERYDLPGIRAQHIDRLEALIDELTAQLGSLENFILPGGSVGASNLQLARAICRRAERDVATLSEVEEVQPLVQAYLNRLSDALFMMARYENRQQGIPEPIWDSHA